MCERVYAETIIPSTYSRMRFLSTLTFHDKSNPQHSFHHCVVSAVLFFVFMLNRVSYLTSSLSTKFSLQYI